MRKAPPRDGERGRERVGGRAAGAQAREAGDDARHRARQRHQRLSALTQPPAQLQELLPGLVEEMVKSCEHRRARAHAEGLEEGRKRHAVAGPRGPGGVGAKCVPQRHRERGRKASAHLGRQTGHVSSCRKKFSAASAKVVRGSRAPIDFLRAAIDMHSSRCGPRQLSLCTIALQQHRT